MQTHPTISQRPKTKERPTPLKGRPGTTEQRPPNYKTKAQTIKQEPTPV